MATSSTAAKSSSNSLAAQVAASQPGFGYGGGSSLGAKLGGGGSASNALAAGVMARPASQPAAQPSRPVSPAASAVPSSSRGGVSATDIAMAAPRAADDADKGGKGGRPATPFMNAKGEPYVSTYSVDIGGAKSPADVSYAIRDRTSAKGMQPQALKQLDSAAQAASMAGLARITVVAAKGQGHLSHLAGTEWDIVGYNPDGSMWTPAQRVAVANGAKGAGANRFGLYSFGPGYLGSGTLHFGYAHPGSPGNITWGYKGQVRGPGSRMFQDPAEKAFSQAVMTGGKFDPSPFLTKGDAAAAMAKAGTPAKQAVAAVNKPVQPMNALAPAAKEPAPVLSYVQDPKDGVFKEDPYKALINTAGADAPTKVPVLKYGDGFSKPDPKVRAYQTMLASKGLYHGRIDGIFGEETDKATRVYQHAAKLTVDGKIGLGQGAETGPALEHDFMLSRIRPDRPAPPAPANPDQTPEASEDMRLVSHLNEIQNITDGKSVAPGSMLFQKAQNEQNYQDPLRNRNYMPPALAKGVAAAPASSGGQVSEGYSPQIVPPGYQEWKQSLSPDIVQYAQERTAQLNKELDKIGSQRRPMTVDEILMSSFEKSQPAQQPAPRKVKTVPVAEGYYGQPGEENAVKTMRGEQPVATAVHDPFNTKSYNKDQSRMSQYANEPPQVTSDAQYDALPSGTVFRDPEGNLRRKP